MHVVLSASNNQLSQLGILPTNFNLIVTRSENELKVIVCYGRVRLGAAVWVLDVRFGSHASINLYIIGS